jgi:glycosyltransferase involved in cell wall biosynthesis
MKPRTLYVVPHGVPDVDFKSPPPTWSTIRTSKRPRTLKLCSVGFFRPDKGIETIVRAVRALRETGIAVEYVIAGEPQRQFDGQAEYLHKIQSLVTELGVDDCIRIEARFLTRDEQIQVIQNAHAGVFAYQDEGQASSGAVPLVLASGRPVVCTPFEFAVDKRRELGKPIWLATDFTPRAVGIALLRFVGSGASYRRDCRTLHARIQPWSWGRVGATYAAAFETCRAASASVETTTALHRTGDGGCGPSGLPYHRHHVSRDRG